MKFGKKVVALAALSCTGVFAQDPPKTEAQAEAESQQPPRAGKILERADADKDGKVTYDELKKIAPSLSEERFKVMDRNGDGSLSPEEMPGRGARFAQADTNGDKKLSKDEFKTAFPNIPEERFAKMDTNGDGQLDGAEAQQLREGMRLGERFGEGRGREHIFERADKDGDGKVTAEEFKQASPNIPEDRFKQLDRNGDGAISKDDFGGGKAEAVEKKAE